MENPPELNSQKQWERNLKELEARALSFEEGVSQSVEKIENLFNALDRSVYVMINGSSINVGKSFLLATLQRKLLLLGIPTQHTDLGIYNSKSKTVIFTLNPFFENAKNIGFKENKFSDLYIAIYRPDKKFVPVEFAEYKNDNGVRNGNPDIIICNQDAKNKY